ncbi:hypothetical protein SUGI_0135070 [Cryptomeria japonica]|nr:hypothetical protein SUGI_0135070 [Cryptomeria japonica]
MLLSADGEWKQHIEVEKEICACTRCGSKLHNADKCRLFVRKAFKRPHKKPKQVWKVKEKNLEPKTLLLEGPKSINIGPNQDVSAEIPTQDIPLDSNTIPNNDIVMNPIKYPTTEEVLQESDSDTSESGSDGDQLNTVKPRCINQSANIVLRGAKGTRGRKSHKTVREQRANEKGIVKSFEDEWINLVENCIGQLVCNYMENREDINDLRIWKKINIGNPTLCEKLWDAIKDGKIPASSKDDNIFWCASKSGVYGSKLGYEVQRQRGTCDAWGNKPALYGLAPDLRL